MTSGRATFFVSDLFLSLGVRNIHQSIDCRVFLHDLLCVHGTIRTLINTVIGLELLDDSHFSSYVTLL